MDCQDNTGHHWIDLGFGRQRCMRCGLVDSYIPEVTAPTGPRCRVCGQQYSTEYRDTSNNMCGCNHCFKMPPIYVSDPRDTEIARLTAELTNANRRSEFHHQNHLAAEAELSASRERERVLREAIEEAVAYVKSIGAAGGIASMTLRLERIAEESALRTGGSDGN